MLLVTLYRPGGSDPGVRLGDEFLNLACCRDVLPAAQMMPSTLRGILEGGEDAISLVRRVVDRVGSSDRHANSLRQEGALTPVGKTRLMAPLPNTSLILAVGQNYGGHLREMGGNAAPEHPNGFTKPVASVIGPGAPIVLPSSHPNMVDWEGEFSIVIGRECHDVKAADALNYVAGYTIVNDVSARDWVAATRKAEGRMAAVRAWDDNRLGKQFPTFCPMGPGITTADEIDDPDNLDLRTTVNGEVMQSSNTNDLVFGVAAIVERFSKFFRFVPGDVITTGSPSGVGMGRNPPIFLKSGDVVEVTVQGLGTLSNPVVAADGAH